MRFAFDDTYLVNYVKRNKTLTKNLENFRKALTNARMFIEESFDVFSPNLCAYCRVTKCNGGEFNRKYKRWGKIDNLVLLQPYE